MEPKKGLYRSSTHRMLGGVAGGLAEAYGWNVGTVRLAFLVSTFLPGPQFLMYIAAWILLPVK